VLDEAQAAGNMSTGGEVANALVCKTSIHGFKSHSVLHKFNSLRKSYVRFQQAGPVWGLLFQRKSSNGTAEISARGVALNLGEPEQSSGLHCPIPSMRLKL
jgi:hypothetical protein